MRTEYTAEFRRLVLAKLLTDPSTSMRALARELGTPKSTIWCWRAEIRKLVAMDKPANGSPPHSAATKWQLLLEGASLRGEPLARYLRHHGVRAEEFAQWQQAVLHGLAPEAPAVATPTSEPRPTCRDARRIAQLEKQLRAAQALLELKKKVAAWQGLTRPSSAEELALEAELAALTAEAPPAVGARRPEIGQYMDRN